MEYVEFDIKHPVDINLLLGLWSHLKGRKAQKYIHIIKIKPFLAEVTSVIF